MATTTTTMWPPGPTVSADGAPQSVRPLLVANIFDWALFILLSIQVYIVLRRRALRRSHTYAPAVLAPKSSDFNALAGNAGPQNSTQAHSTASFDPYAIGYPPCSPTTPSSMRPSGQFSFHTRQSAVCNTINHHPRVPRELTVLTTLICTVYVLQLAATVLSSIYTWLHTTSGLRTDTRMMHTTRNVWMRAVSSDVIGSFVFMLSLGLLSYHIYLLSPATQPRSPVRSFMHSKSQHLQPCPLPRHRSFRLLTNLTPLLLFLLGVITGLSGIINGVMRIVAPPPLGSVGDFSGSTWIWLTGSIVLNTIVFSTIVRLLLRCNPYSQSGRGMRFIRILGEAGFVPWILSLVGLGLCIAYKQQMRWSTLPLVPALLLPGLYANTALLALTQSPLYLSAFGPNIFRLSTIAVGDSIQLPPILDRPNRLLSLGDANKLGDIKGVRNNNPGDKPKTVNNNDVGAKAVGFILSPPRPPKIIPAYSMHMDRDVIGESSSKSKPDGQHEVHILTDLGGKHGSVNVARQKRRRNDADSQYWFSEDEDEGEEEAEVQKPRDVSSIDLAPGGTDFSTVSQKELGEHNLSQQRSTVDLSPHHGYTPGPSVDPWNGQFGPPPGNGTTVAPPNRIADYRVTRHNSTSSSIPQFQPRSSEDARSLLSVATNHKKAPLHIYRHESQGFSLPPRDNRVSCAGVVKTKRTLAGERLEAVGDALEPTSPPPGSVLDDTSVMIISAGNNDPSIVEPSMYKAASVAATRASTGSAWSSYTYPKPMAFPELDEDLRHGRYEPNPDPDPFDRIFFPSDPQGGSVGQSEAGGSQSPSDGERHPYARAAFDAEAQQEKAREDENRKRRWRVHPLQRMVAMGRLRW